MKLFFFVKIFFCFPYLYFYSNFIPKDIENFKIYSNDDPHGEK